MTSEETALLESLVGKRIVGFDSYDNSDSNSFDHTSWLGGVTLSLDDGRHIQFDGWGHDWWGLAVEEKTT